jgi:glutamate-ammonia-ligase adenylyltransferase
MAMRQKMRDGHPNTTDLFDIKHDPGGIVDVEFCVQYLVLAHARQHPQLLDNAGNIALLKRCGDIGLIPAELANAAANAYRELRKQQHAVKLRGAHEARTDTLLLGNHRETALRLWQAVFATS